MPKQPSFCIGIGAAKAGTTWLSDYLARHPDTAMSPIKELHYFDAVYRSDLSGFWNKKWAETLNLLVQNYQTSPSQALLVRIRCVALRLEMIERPAVYRQYFDFIVGDSTKVFGEVTPAYALLPERGYQAISDMYPDAKFIFMVRDPVDRFLSKVRFTTNTISGHPHSSDAVDLNEKALSCINNPHFLLRSDYKATLTTLFKIVRKQNVLIVFYEDLFSPEYHARETDRLCNFLELDTLASSTQDRINASEKFDFEPHIISKARQTFSPTYEYMLSEYGDRLPRCWRTGN